MKKVICMLVLVIVLALTFSGCGKSEEVKNVEAMIEGIGTVTADSREAIDAALSAYAGLSAEDAEKVENYAVLEAADAACADRELEEKLVGDWCYNMELTNIPKMTNIAEEYTSVDISLKEDMTAKFETKDGNWYVENQKLHINYENVTKTYTVNDEVNSMKSEQGGKTLIPASELRANLDERFVIVELTNDNYADYIELASNRPDMDEFTDTYAVLNNKMYEQGLYYYQSHDLSIVVDIPAYTKTVWVKVWKQEKRTEAARTVNITDCPFGKIINELEREDDWPDRHFITLEDISIKEATGYLVFVKQEYVESAEFSKFGRILKLKDSNRALETNIEWPLVVEY